MSALEDAVRELADALDGLEAKLDRFAAGADQREQLRAEARAARGRATEARQEVSAAPAPLRAVIDAAHGGGGAGDDEDEKDGREDDSGAADPSDEEGRRGAGAD